MNTINTETERIMDTCQCEDLVDQLVMLGLFSRNDKKAIFSNEYCFTDKTFLNILLYYMSRESPASDATNLCVVETLSENVQKEVILRTLYYDLFVGAFDLTYITTLSELLEYAKFFFRYSAYSPRNKPLLLTNTMRLEYMSKIDSICKDVAALKSKNAAGILDTM